MAEGNTGGRRYRETPFGLRAVLEPEHARKLFTRNPGDPAFGLKVMASRSAVLIHRSTTLMHEHGKSDRPIVPKKAANKGEPPSGELSAERLEERGLAKGNSIRHDTGTVRRAVSLQLSAGRWNDGAMAR